MKLRVHTAKIQTFEKLPVSRHAAKLILSDTKDLPLRKRIEFFLLRSLLSFQSGVLWMFEIKEGLYEERLRLEDLMKRSLIESYGEGPLFADYPPLHFFGITFKHRPESESLHSWGYTLPYEDRGDALRGALWEMVERHATYYEPRASTVHYPKLEKGNASWLEKYLSGYTKQQCVDMGTTKGDSVPRDVPGCMVESVTGDRPRFFPISMLYWGDRRSFPVPPQRDMTTSGCGGGRTREGAIASAVYELIERDVFMLHWFTKTPPRRITLPHTESPFFAHVRDAESRFGLEVYFFDMSYDIEVPVTACLIIDPVLNMLAFGAKATTHLEDALRGAYMEALGTLTLIRNRGRVIEPTLLDTLIAQKEWGSKAVNKSVRVNLYNSKKGIETMRALWCGGSDVTFSARQEHFESVRGRESAYDHLMSQFRAHIKAGSDGHHIYVHACTSALTKEFHSHVVRAYVPALLALHLDERFVAPVSPRVFEFSRVKGSNLTCESELNHLPHPFP
jgi:thiazole/oxazole-forming peptide maturase SagD family component